MAMVVLQLQAGAGFADQPSARSVFADVERNLELGVAAFPDMHDQPTFESRRCRIIDADLALEGFSAVATDGIEEGIMGRNRYWAGCR
ncbi:MAG: hypothetical protein ACO24O_06620 [Arenimonas sp.]